MSEIGISDVSGRPSVEATPASGGARRSPVQERSHGTVERILNATSTLLASHTVEEITTTRIANEAGVSIGALYRFFPDKQSIVDAIAVRHMNDFESFFAADMPAMEMTDGPAFLGAVIDRFVKFLDDRPDFRRLAFGGQISAETRKQQSRPDAGTPGLLRTFMIRQIGIADSADLGLELKIAIETGERLLAFAYEQENSEDRAAVIGEMKAILGLYLFR